MNQTKLLTADDLFAMGSDCHCELVNGVLVPLYEGELGPMSPAGFDHGRVAYRAALVVGPFVEARDLGWCSIAETGYRLRRDPDTVRAPDFAFVAKGRVTPDMDTTRYLDLAPDLVVEVVSPSDRAAEVAAKVLEYLDAGVRLVWVAYPQSRAVAVHSAVAGHRLITAEDELSGEAVLPGFTCRVADLFST